MNATLPLVTLIFVMVLGGLIATGLGWLVWTLPRSRVPAERRAACPACAYRLAHRMDQCPECGTDLGRRGVAAVGAMPIRARTVRVLVIVGVAILAPVLTFQLTNWIGLGFITRQVRTEVWRIDASGAMVPEATFEESVWWFGRDATRAKLGNGTMPAVPERASRTVAVWPRTMGIWRDDERDVGPGPPLADVRVPGEGPMQPGASEPPAADVGEEAIDLITAALDREAPGTEDPARREIVGHVLAGPEAFDAAIVAAGGDVRYAGSGMSMSSRTWYTRIVRTDANGVPAVRTAGMRLPVKRRVIYEVRSLLPFIVPGIWLMAILAIAGELLRGRRSGAVPIDDPSIIWSTEPPPKRRGRP
ncbi:MAG: hypothetical protein AB8G96_12300 [Phycisphaerales bacterium]